MKIKAYDLADIAKYVALRQFNTTYGTGATEVFVDGPVVPKGFFGVVLAISLSNRSIWTTAAQLGAFICDSSMNWNQSPLLAGVLDTSKIGPSIFASAPPSLGNVEFPMAVLAEGQFIRFTTYQGISPLLNEFAMIDMGISLVPLCEQ